MYVRIQKLWRNTSKKSYSLPNLYQSLAFWSAIGVGDPSDVRNVHLAISMKNFPHLLRLWALERPTLHKDIRNAYSLKNVCVFLNLGVDLLSHRSSGVRGPAVLSQSTGDEQHCCLCCVFSVPLTKHGRRRNLSDKTTEGRDQSTVNEDIGTILIFRRRAGDLQLGMETWRGIGMDLRWLLPKIDHSVVNSSWQFQNQILQGKKKVIENWWCRAEFGWCAVSKPWNTYRAVSIKEDLKYTGSTAVIQWKNVIRICN